MKEEKTIRISDVVFECLLHWRGVILFIIIGAVLAGVFGYYKSYKESEKAIEQAIIEANSNTSDESLKKDLSQLEISNIRIALNLNTYLEKVQKYRDFFSFQTFDYTRVPTYEFIYMIKAENFTSAHDLANKYALYATSNEFAEYIKDKDISGKEYATELISTNIQGVSNTNIDGGEPAEEGSTEEDYGVDNTCILRIKVIHKDEILCRKLAEALSDFLDEKSGLLYKEATEHEFLCIDSSFAYAADYNLLVKMKAVSDTTDLANQNIGKSVDLLTDKGKLYYELSLKELNYEEIQGKITGDETDVVEVKDDILPTEQKPKGEIKKKYVLAGALGFALLYLAIVILIKYLLNKRIQENDNLSEIFKVPFIGSVRTEADDKLFLGSVDRLIVKVRDRNKRVFSTDEAIDIIASSVKISAGKNDLKEIAAIGCNMTEIKDISKKLYDKLKDAGIEVTELDNILYNPENLSRLPESKGAVIVEQIGDTLYDEIAKEIEILKSQDIKVLGIVTID